jgi:hypothetical protein
MPRNRWGPRRGDFARIQRHLDRQRDVPEGFVRIVKADLTYEVVRVGHDAEGEGEPNECD